VLSLQGLRLAMDWQCCLPASKYFHDNQAQVFHPICWDEGWGPGIPKSWKAQPELQMLQFRTGSMLVKRKVMIYYCMQA